MIDILGVVVERTVDVGLMIPPDMMLLEEQGHNVIAGVVQRRIERWFPTPGWH